MGNPPGRHTEAGLPRNQGINRGTGVLERSCFKAGAVPRWYLGTRHQYRSHHSEPMSKPLVRSRLKYVRHPALPGIELLIANPSVETWRMYHQRYVICGCTSVATAWEYRHKSVLMEDGMTALMEPGETHRVVTKYRPSCFVTLFIEGSNLLKVAEELHFTGAPHFGVAKVDDPLVLQELMRLSALLQDGSDALQLQSQLYDLLGRVLNYAEGQRARRKPGVVGMMRSLNRARDFLEEHVNETVTLDDLAAASAVSRFHLARGFAQEFGIPPHAYQVQLRVKHACALLRSGMACAEVAPSVGFADQSHFARHFKRIMGVTPSKYAHPKCSAPQETDETALRNSSREQLLVP